jgi:hypothetical protein
VDKKKLIKSLGIQISALAEEYNKMSSLQEQISNKARDSAGKGIIHSYSIKTVIRSPSEMSNSVYSLWKRGSRNEHYLVANKKIARAIAKINKKLGALKREKRKLENELELEQCRTDTGDR